MKHTVVKRNDIKTEGKNGKDTKENCRINWYRNISLE